MLANIVSKTCILKSRNRRLRTLLAFPSPTTFEKASPRRNFSMLEDLEMPVKSEDTK